ncbi:MAG: hypothetical protein ABL930_11150, partial [Pseudobdellovibrio sp.]
MKLVLALFAANLFFGHSLYAQEQNLEDQEVINIENLYKNNPPPQQVPQPESKSAEAITQQEQNEQSQIKNNTEVQNSKVKSLTDLNK